MAYAVGHISGGHFNPAVTLGLVVAGKFQVRDAAPYIAAQVAGAIVAAAVLYVIAHGVEGFDASASGFAANGYDDHSPGGYSLVAGFGPELTLTAGRGGACYDLYHAMPNGLALPRPAGRGPGVRFRSSFCNSRAFSLGAGCPSSYRMAPFMLKCLTSASKGGWR